LEAAEVLEDLEAAAAEVAAAEADFKWKLICIFSVFCALVVNLYGFVFYILPGKTEHRFYKGGKK
jgi:hypothetical protein